jgi:hypothetical protein
MLLNPYFWGLAALSLALSMFSGCRWQASIDAGKVDQANDALTLCDSDRRALNAALVEVNTAARRAKREAEAQAALAAEAVEQAERLAAARDTQIRQAEKELDKAKRDPGCKAQLEAPLCTVLH